MHITLTRRQSAHSGNKSLPIVGMTAAPHFGEFAAEFACIGEGAPRAIRRKGKTFSSFDIALSPGRCPGPAASAAGVPTFECRSRCPDFSRSRFPERDGRPLVCLADAFSSYRIHAADVLFARGPIRRKSAKSRISANGSSPRSIRIGERVSSVVLFLLLVAARFVYGHMAFAPGRPSLPRFAASSPFQHVRVLQLTVSSRN